MSAWPAPASVSLPTATSRLATPTSWSPDNVWLTGWLTVVAVAPNNG
jgi:hypothetical protein